jgi:hypothetical protein
MPDLNSALRRLAEFVTNLDFDTEPPPSFITSEPLVILSKDDATLFFRGEDVDNYTESVQGIVDAVSAKEIISRDSVERLVNDLILALALVKRDTTLEFEIELKDRIRSIRTALQSEPTEWEFYVPVIGFAPSGLPFTVGTVEFYQADGTGTQEYWRRACELNPAYEGKRLEECLLADFPAQFGNSTIGRVRVLAQDLIAAQNRAMKAVRRTLDCINFFADKNKGTALHVKGDVEQGQRLDAVIQISQPAWATGRTTRIAPWRALPIRQISKRPGFDRISELLAKKALSKLEDRILRAFQWAGRARVEPRTEESFLLFAVALETLLLKDSGNPADLLYQLKLRTAHLVSGLDLDSRKLTVKQIGQLYNTRSKIVHTGKFDVTDSDLYLIDEYTRIALFIVLDREPFRSMSAEEDFEAWFETRLLGLTQTTDERRENTTAPGTP